MSLSSRAFWRPGGWENLCRLMCHCVRHIGLDNKHGRSVEAIHSFLSRWKACMELCAGTQKSRAAREELDGEREPSDFQVYLKSVAMHSIPPERKPVALSNSSIYCG